MTKLKSKILRTILAMALITPYFSFALPTLSKAEAAGKGNCAIGYYEEIGTAPNGTIVKDETWTDDDSSKTFTVASDKIISVVFIKSGANELDCQQNAITTNGSYSNGHFTVSGIGTNSVTVTENGGQDVSHTEFIVTDADPETPSDPTCVVGEPTWAYAVVDANQGTLKNGSPITDVNRTDSSLALGVNDFGVNNPSFYSLGYGGSIVITFEFPISNGLGNDLSVYEVTNGRSTYPIELADIEVSQDGINWYFLGTASNKSTNGISSFDLDNTDSFVKPTWVQYIRISDVTVDPTLEATADGFDLDAIYANYGNCEELSLEDLEGISDDISSAKCETIYGYKWLDENKNGEWDNDESGLENWEINLDGGTNYQVAETFEVDAKGAISTSSVLEEGSNYIIKTERNDAYAGDDIDFDAKYSITNRIVGDTWTDSVSGYVSYGEELLDLQIDGLSPDWGEYNESHTYYVSIVGDGQAHDFQIYDIYYPNNSGSLTVSILKAGSSSTVTDETGYYEFIVCDLGEYTLEETQQPEYKQTYPEESVHYFTLTEEEGIGTESEDFNFGNRETDPADLVIEKEENDDDDIVEAGDEITYTIRYANIGEDDAVNVVITETVPAHTTYTGDEDWVCDANPAVAGTVCTYEVGDLAGQNTTAELADYDEVTFTVTVSADVEDGDIIDNVATISSDSEEENTDNNESDADRITVTVEEEEVGEVAGETTVVEEEEEKINEEVLGVDQSNPTLQTFNPAVLGASTETLAKTGSTIAWLIATIGLITVGGSIYALTKKRR